jgi:TetR/AcrR family transcriptional repressor of nem operon
MTSKSSSKKALSRERILGAASTAVRRSGFHGVGVADVMNDAGLTHGGFYSHFSSRESLLAEAVIHASREIGELLMASVETAARSGESKFSAFVGIYLADRNINESESGCPVAALCGEMRYQSGEVLDSSRQIVTNLHKLVIKVLPANSSAQTGWAVTSSLLGAMQLARALGDNKQGRAVLAAARVDLIALYDNEQ